GAVAFFVISKPRCPSRRSSRRSSPARSARASSSSTRRSRRSFARRAGWCTGSRTTCPSCSWTRRSRCGRDARGEARRARVAARLAPRQDQRSVRPHRSMRTALLAWLARIPERIGFAGTPASLLYTARVPTREKAFLRREADLAAARGAAPGAMQLVRRADWLSAARSALRESREEKLAAI